MLPALVWKVLEWIWYTCFSKTAKPETDAVAAAKCPISGITETADTKCPGSAKKETELVED